MERSGDAARELWRRIAAAPDGRVTEDRQELVGRLAPAGLVEDDPRETERYAQSLLRLHGIRADPRLTDPGSSRTTLRADRGLAVQGAVALTLLALVVGLAGSAVYGVILFLAGAAGVAIVALWFDWLDGWVPAAVPRGRTLGGTVALPLIVVAFLAIVLPIRASRMHTGNPGYASSLLQGARDSLAAGDLTTAQNRVVQAIAADPQDAQIAPVLSDITVARIQAALNEQARKEGVYSEAERAFRHGDVRTAIRLMSSIKGFRDADQLLAAYRRAPGR